MTTRALFLTVALAMNAPAALSIAHATHSSTLADDSATVVFSTAPTAGNLLVLFLGTPPRGTISPPAGWTKLDSALSPWANAELYSFYHVVGSGETNSYTFTSTQSQDQWEFVGYEVTGQAASDYIDQHGITSTYGSSLATPSKTPSVDGTLVLSGLSVNSLGITLSSISTGWTNDATENSNFHPTWAASRDSLTADTTTAITNTFTISADDNMLAAVVFIAPAVSTGPPNSQVVIF
jgi:hypothetical protein